MSDPTNNLLTMQAQPPAPAAIPTLDQTAPVPVPTLDLAGFPHILTRIIELAPIPSLLVLRGTCRTARDQIDTNYLARHIVLKGTVSRTRHGNISLRKRPELLQHARILDLKLRCSCSPWKPCGGLHDMVKAFERVVEEPCGWIELDVIRIFTDRLGAHQKRLIPSTAINARVTVYFVDLPYSTPTQIGLRFDPICGSQEVMISYLCDLSSPNLWRTWLFLNIPFESGAKYTLLFRDVPSTIRTPSFGGWSAPPALLPYPLSHLGIHMACLLLDDLAMAKRNGYIDPSVTVVGVDQWPEKWFPSTCGKLSDLKLPRSVILAYFKNLLVGVAEAQAIQDEGRLRVVSITEFKDQWRATHSDGLGILVYP